MDSNTISPFTLSIPHPTLSDLHHRLALTRWPDSEPVPDWSQGVPLAKIQALCTHWRDHYSWRRCEALLNSWPQYTTTISGVPIYFLHIRSPHRATALPLLLMHGWPGSVLEFRHVVAPLTDPVAHGGVAGDAFDLVIPALPGYGFSDKPKDVGWTPSLIAEAWAVLMQRLGYRRWVAQGGDWGADVSAELGRLAPPGLAAVHMNSMYFDARRESGSGELMSEGEMKALRLQERFEKDEYGYMKVQMTRPQTVAYGLSDSPSGQAAWIYEKIHAWSQHDGEVETLFSKDEILDTIMLYWLTNAGASSARIYWEAEDSTALPIKIPVGVSWFPGDQTYAPREWCERYYENIIHWREVEKGGHFAAWEQPEIFVREMRDCFRSVR